MLIMGRFQAQDSSIKKDGIELVEDPCLKTTPPGGHLTWPMFCCKGRETDKGR